MENYRYKQYDSRSDEKYRDRLITLFKDILSLNTLKTKEDIEEWKKKFTSKSEGDERIRTFDGIEYTHTLRIDFNGLAATTFLLGNKIKQNFELVPNQISEAFISICREPFTETLRLNKISLRVRFIFPYIYSNFTYTLMESLESKKRGTMYDRKTSYNFDIEEFNNFKIKKDQKDALKVIQDITNNNKSLVITEPEKASHTLQVRFTCLPITVCNLMIANLAFTDPYLFLKTNNNDEFLFYYPLTESYYNDRSSTLYNAMAKSFDYYWANELTLFCKDATHFEPESSEYTLHCIKTPEEIFNSSFKHRIRRTLHHLNEPVDSNKFEKQIEKWSKNLKERIKENCSRYNEFNNENDKTEYDAVDEKNQIDESSIDIGFKSDGENEYYYLKLKINNIYFNEFKRAKSLANQGTSASLGYPFKILLHYCLVEKGFLKGGSMFENKNISFEQKHKVILQTLRELVTDKNKDKKQINRTFLQKNIINFSKERGTSFNIKNITVEFNKEAFEILTYSFKTNKNKKVTAHVVPEADLEIP